MTDKTLLGQLATYRLEHDLSFEELAGQFTEAGYPMRARALHLMLTNRLRTKPHDRTLFKVQRFLERLGRPTKRTRRSEGSAA